MGGGRWDREENRKQTRSRTVQVQGGRASEGGTRDGWCGWKIKSEGARKEGERTSRLEKDVWEKRATRFSWGKGNELGDTGWLLVLGAWGDSRLKMILADPLACQSWPHPGAVGVSGPSGASRLWAAVKIEASSGSLFSLAEPQRHTHVGFSLTKPGVVVQSVTVLWGRGTGDGTLLSGKTGDRFSGHSGCSPTANHDKSREVENVGPTAGSKANLSRQLTTPVTNSTSHSPPIRHQLTRQLPTWSIGTTAQHRGSLLSTHRIRHHAVKSRPTGPPRRSRRFPVRVHHPPPRRRWPGNSPLDRPRSIRQESALGRRDGRTGTWGRMGGRKC